MVSKKIKITNTQGFHMHPASVFAAEMEKFKCNVTNKILRSEIKRAYLTFAPF